MNRKKSIYWKVDTIKMEFKNVGNLHISVTAQELRAKIYDIPNLGLHEQVEVLKSEPRRTREIKEHKKVLPSKNKLLHHLLRLKTPLVKGVYVVVDIQEIDAELDYSYISPKFLAYFFVKKRNYNKYLAQILSGNEKIDYILIRPQQEFDKAMSLGLAERI